MKEGKKGVMKKMMTMMVMVIIIPIDLQVKQGRRRRRTRRKCPFGTFGANVSSVNFLKCFN